MAGGFRGGGGVDPNPKTITNLDTYSHFCVSPLFLVVNAGSFQT